MAPDLLGRDFHADAPSTIWAGDITYIWTAEGLWYLAVLLDLFSRRVVGWQLSSRLSCELALGALEQAVKRRQPPPGLIHHTDRGCQRQRLHSTIGYVSPNNLELHWGLAPAA